MNNQIGIGILVGLTVTSTIYILQSDYFTKIQKVILGILFIFPPAQWVLAIISGLWNKYNNVSIGFKIDKTEKQIAQLQNFKNKGLLTEEECEEKSKVIIRKYKKEILIKTKEYKSLKKLNESGILTDKEFKQKIKLLKNSTKVFEEDTNSFEFWLGLFIFLIIILAIILAIISVIKKI
jgi:ABC-type multidrug transport system fused ATPase/permease subunit